MPAAATCTAVDIRSDGSRSVQWSDGSSLDFPTIQDVRDYVDPVDSGVDGTTLAKRILLARYIRLDADGSDTASIVGKTCTVNPGAPNPVQIG